ncbi:MAG: 3-deoxy-D-manno-octulosonic acid transferase [Rhabdochlamydiaceae bacterium]|nr:3-deoxy-D-manno-octulosonic acid transferase [Rhabdochlamydiaceae bacterium]
MFSLFYNCALFFLALLALPKLLWQWWVLGKYRESLQERLGLKLPAFLKEEKVIWIHAVSVGETRSVIPLFKKIKQIHPNAAFVISSTTETGHAEAKRSMPDAALHIFLPFDFSWIIRRTIARLHPDVLIFVESDFWFHLIEGVKKQGGRVLLVNGKVSERSMKRFCKVPFFTNKLFGRIDHLCVQSPLFLERFAKMGVPAQKMTATGNLKFDAALKHIEPQERQRWREELGIQSQDRVIVIGSTHAPEEEWLLSALDAVWKQIPELKVLIVPRHPERFGAVAEQIRARGWTLSTYSERSKQTGDERIVLIDAMGLLITCYQLAEVAIVAGSFTDKVGGHNAFEPVLLGIPVLFGPHMHTQNDIASLILQGRAGKQVSLSDLPDTLIAWLSNEQELASYANNCKELSLQTAGSVERTYNALSEFL